MLQFKSTMHQQGREDQQRGLEPGLAGQGGLQGPRCAASRDEHPLCHLAGIVVQTYYGTHYVYPPWPRDTEAVLLALD